jgi:hypothetical protein
MYADCVCTLRLQFVCSGSIVRSSIVASRVTDPGSNPGRSTNQFFVFDVSFMVYIFAFFLIQRLFGWLIVSVMIWGRFGYNLVLILKNFLIS